MAKGSRLTTCFCVLILAGVGILGIFMCKPAPRARMRLRPCQCLWARVSRMLRIAIL